MMMQAVVAKRPAALNAPATYAPKAGEFAHLWFGFWLCLERPHGPASIGRLRENPIAAVNLPFKAPAINVGSIFSYIIAAGSTEDALMKFGLVQR